MDLSPLDLAHALQDGSEASPSLRERLTEEVWSHTMMRLGEASASGVTDAAFRFLDGGSVSEAVAGVLDPFTVGTMTTTFREWLMFDYPLDGQTPVESLLEDDRVAEEREALRSWRDSVLSLYRVELLWGSEDAALFTDVFRGETVRVEDFGSMFDLCGRGRHLATRLIADGPAWRIEGSWLQFPPVVERATDGLRTAWEEYRASHPGSSKTEFLKANGHLLYRLWNAELEHVLARAGAADPPGGGLEALRNAVAGAARGPGAAPGGDLEGSLREAIAELANLAEGEGPPDRPDRWQIDILRFSARVGAVAGDGPSPGSRSGPSFVVVCTKAELAMPANLVQLDDLPEDPGAQALICRDALLDSVDGYADELPRVVEVRHAGLEAPLAAALRAVLGDVDVSVRVGEDFTRTEATLTGIMTDVLTGGRAGPPES